MNASLPPDDERREEQARQDVPKQAPPVFGLGSMLGVLVAVGIVVIMVLPALLNSRPPAQRSVHGEMEQRQQAIEQAAREARDEAGLADNR